MNATFRPRRGVSRTGGTHLLAAVLLCTGCAPDSTAFPPAHQAALADSVREVMAELERLWARAALDSVGALYSTSDSFRFYEEGRLRYSSSDGVREALAEIPAGIHLTTVYDDVQVLPLAAGRALANATFRTEARDPDGATVFSFEGAVTVLWVREADGWRIASGHSSTVRPESRSGDWEGRDP